MARKIAVEGEIFHYKKSRAELLVRRLLAEWIVRGVSIRLLRVAEPADVRDLRTSQSAKPFIPERMPPAEVGGCHFVGPEGAEEGTIAHQVRIRAHQRNYSRLYISRQLSA